MNRPYPLPFSQPQPKREFFKVVLTRLLSLILVSSTSITMTHAQSTSNDTDETLCFTQNLYFEARSEGREGMIAVGWVVLNRVESDMYPNSVCGVIYDGGERPPCEFNWWCDGRSDQPTEPESWELANQITRQMLNNPPADPTDGALWFHMDSISVPGWLNSRERTLHLGAHYFYK
ncbi:MAG: cell wall hydrolase [Gammaproteobacteria bacterium]|jgi:spore germination cell wall hydrolase CwlJ-like protein